ncbi:phage terminase large subunit [Elizabethkingia meningoseptica]|uniref:phage terminase large subunit n=1 Tax=Elizabethkingia meningoseptica TaxID=238 RepID=UPI0023AFACF9|nr:phage terminase large subunit [Elizabethkingia meningoseptica]MDE5530457.1 phage terminase large subunit [Elizabethkingia meningoseptica]MDE5534014.1 phage terminase large subunit [Elizabethkingia meningoseptica]MDE5542710.1 phage terminase large subunit [Elizabethkingia meningoseptica]
MSKTLEIRDIDATKTWVLGSTLNFTRYFFKQNFGKKFIVNKHHEIICDALDRVIQGKTKRLMLNIAPRYSKTELVIKNFSAYGFAINQASKFIHLSYSADLAMDNSSEVQGTVTSEAFQELFDLELTSESKKKWQTSKGGGFYAVSSGGQVTGFGAGAVQEEKDNEGDDEDFENFIPYFDSEFAGAILIDDPIKPDDAQSDQKREAVNQKFDTTIRNRVNSRDTPIIIIMQRLHMNDLCGYLQKLEGVLGIDDGGEWELIELPCLYKDENGEDAALWSHKHTVDELKQMREKNPFVFETQYQQNPKPKEGLLYDRPFRTYPVGIVPYSQKMQRKNYTDVADTGKDYLCSICYTETERGVFIEDILYTQKSQEYTEPKQAEQLAMHRTEIAHIESNNGGRSYARNVEAQTRLIGNRATEFKPFHQGSNKAVRIFTRANEVMNMIYMPEGWDKLYPDFYNHVTTYMKTGDNKFDDAPDTLTGIVEKIGEDDGDSAEGYF